jgi:hypothetical protein
VRGFIIIVTLSIASLIGSSAAVAQEGFPLKGSWVGEWGPSKQHSDDLLMVINWDGKAITGMVNPGTDNMALKTATLKPEGWTVHFEFDGKDAKGAAVSYILDGKIENLPFTNRSVTGTWKGGAETGKFKLVRQ